MKEKIIRLLKLPIIYVLCIVILGQTIIYKASPEYGIKPDTSSYYQEYGDKNIFKGELDEFRTPGYPYFIKFIKLFSNNDDSLYKNIVSVQKFLFVIAVILVYCTMMKITKKKLISSIVSIIIGISPGLLVYNTLILTEALGIFSIVLLIYLTTIHICKPRKITAILTSILIFFMIMLRPGFIYLIPIYAVFWILKWLLNKKEMKDAILGIISLIVCTLLIFGYCMRIKQLYGCFMISSVTYVNDLVTIADSKTFTETSNEELKKIMADIKGDSDDEDLSWKAATAISKKHRYNNNDEIKQFVKEAKSSEKYFKYLIEKVAKTNLLTISTMRDVISYSTSVYLLQSLVQPLNFATVIVMLAVIAIYLIYRLFKHSEIDWFLAMLFVFILANIFTLIVGAPFEQQRLFVTSVIPTIMCIAYIINKIKYKNDVKEIDKENNIFYKFFIEETDNSFIQFIRYGFVGAVSAVVNIGGLFILSNFCKVYYLFANIISFILGLIVNYWMSKKLVFTKETSMNKMVEFITYAIIGVIGLILDTLFMWIFTDKIHLYFMISKIISTVLVFIWNFLARKKTYDIIDKKYINK